MLLGMVVKTALYPILLRKPEISVFGVAQATNVGYLVAFFLDLMYNLIITRKNVCNKIARKKKKERNT
jgi:Na+-driven multidrug efflux pump